MANISIKSEKTRFSVDFLYMVKEFERHLGSAIDGELGLR